MRRPPIPPGPSGLKTARVKVPRSKEAELNLADALRENRERAVSSLEVSRETLERLQSYADLLVKWQRAINLVASSTLESLWTRHILDSAQIAILGAKHQNWADLGSGAGFPGLVIAILAAERPEAGLLPSHRKRSTQSELFARGGPRYRSVRRDPCLPRRGHSSRAAGEGHSRNGACLGAASFPSCARGTFVDNRRGRFLSQGRDAKVGIAACLGDFRVR